jgi:hypothetical protein
VTVQEILGRLLTSQVVKDVRLHHVGQEVDSFLTVERYILMIIRHLESLLPCHRHLGLATSSNLILFAVHFWLKFSLENSFCFVKVFIDYPWSLILFDQAIVVESLSNEV